LCIKKTPLVPNFNSKEMKMTKKYIKFLKKSQDDHFKNNSKNSFDF